MDDLDLEKLKQELHDVSGDSLYDVDEIIQEVGSDSTSGSETASLEQLMKSLGVAVADPEPESEILTETMKTEAVETKSFGTAAPATESMMPEFPAQDEDLSALFLAAEQTQALVEEQAALAEEANGKTEEPDPLEEQDSVFAQLFAQLGELEQEEQPEPLETEPVLELGEEPDLMARLFQQPEEEDPFVQQEKTTALEQPPKEDPFAHAEEDPFVHIQTEALTAADPAEMVSPDSAVDETATAVEEETAPEEDDAPVEIEPETEDDVEPEAKPKQSLFSRWFGASAEQEAEEDAEEETEEDEPAEQNDEALEEATVWEDQPDAVLEEADTEDQPEVQETEETEADAAPDKKQKKGLFARWFGLSDDDDEADAKEEQGSGETADSEESDEEFAYADEPELTDLESDETQLLDALTEQMTQKIDAAQLEPEELQQESTEQEPEAVSEEPEAEEEPKEEKQPKAGFLNKMMDVFGLEIVEEEDENGEEDSEENEEEVSEEEADSLSEPEAKPEEEREPEEEAVAADEPEDHATAAFREVLKQEEEIDAVEDIPEPPKPRPEDTPVISEEELAEFLSDVETEDEEAHVSFEQLLRDSGVETEKAEEPEAESKLVLPEEFPEEETTVYLDIPLSKTAQEKVEEQHEAELFDAAVELQKAQEEQELAEPEQDPDWLGLPMEELCKTAPPMAELRLEGPVMTHEVIRQKEWIMERIRSYKEELLRAQQPESVEIEPEEPSETEETEEIHAADALQQLQQDEQDEGNSVFHDGPTGKPETEAAGQNETIFEITVNVPEGTEEGQTTEEPEDAGQAEKEIERKPKQAQQRTKRKPRAVWPQEKVPKDLNKASRACRLQAKKQARRSAVIGILTLICIYISCAADFSLLLLPDSLNYAYNPSNVLIIFLVLMGVSILLAYDVVWDGIQALVHLVPNLSTLIDFALLLNILHCISRLVSQGEEIPYACVVMLALCAQLRARVSRSTIRHYNYKVAGSAKQPMGLFYHDGPVPHVVKAPLEQVDRFAAQTLRRGVQHRLETVFTIMAVVIAAVLSVIVCIATGDMGRLIYVLAATMTGACQISLICALVMARSHGARRMQRSGAAADGGAGVRKLAAADVVVLTDEDLFPAGSIALAKLELRSNLNDSTALSYAAALTGGSSLGSMLAEEVRARYGAPLAAHHVVRDINGGVRGQIGGLEVMLGSDQYMADHGVIARDVPEHGLVLALDGNVAAILVIDYQVPASLFNAMQMLTEKKTKIWLHTRNHQITPALVEQRYALKKGTVIVPDLETDRALHNPHYTDRDMLCGMLLRDGFVPVSACMTAARAEARISRLGMTIGLCASLLCMLLMTYLCYVFVPADAHPIRVLIYMVLCFIPIFFLENGVDRE